MTETRRTRNAKELWTLQWSDPDDHTVEIVDEQIDNSYRHGNYVYVVVKETLPTGEVTHWSGSYTEDGTGDHNTWRDDEEEDFSEVFPKLVTIQKVIYE